MKTLKVIVAICVAAALTGCGGIVRTKAAADKAITHFHALLNESKFDDIWKESGPQFRGATTREKYDEFIGVVRRKLGKVTSSTNAGWNMQSFNFKTTVAMSQQTVFEQGKGTEAFSFVMEGTNAVLVGYNIQSMDLITK